MNSLPPCPCVPITGGRSKFWSQDRFSSFLVLQKRRSDLGMNSNLKSMRALYGCILVSVRFCTKRSSLINTSLQQ